MNENVPIRPAFETLLSFLCAIGAFDLSRKTHAGQTSLVVNAIVTTAWKALSCLWLIIGITFLHNYHFL